MAFWIWAACLTLVAAVAFWKGGFTERLAAGVYYGAWLTSILVHNRNIYATQWAVFAVDIAVFLILTGLALRSRKFWPIFMAAFQLLAVVTHAGRVVDRSMGAWAYVAAAQIWGYMAIVALAYGTFGAWRERRQLARAGAPVAEPGATRL